MRMSSRGFRVCVFLAVLTLAAFSGCGVEKHLDESVEPLYMAVGDGGTVVYTSGGDPGNWDKVTLGGDPLFGVAYGGGRFVAVGGGGTVWWADADDLGQWHSAGPLAPFTLRAVAYGNGRFVAVGVDGHAFWSKDGSYGSWSGGQVGGGGFAFQGIAFGEGRFVAAGDGGKAYHSSDGSLPSWIDNSPACCSLKSVIYASGRFVAAGDTGTVEWSEDGTGAWTSVGPGANDIRSIAYGYSRFVAVGDAVPIMTTSGLVPPWDESAGPFFLFSIATQGPYGQFVAVGAGGQGWYSRTGELGTWSDLGVLAGVNLNAIVCRY